MHGTSIDPLYLWYKVQGAYAKKIMAAGGWVWFPVCPLSEVLKFLQQPTIGSGRFGCPEVRGVRISEVRNTLAIYMGRSIGATVCVRYTEVVRISEGPLTEVPLYCANLLSLNFTNFCLNERL